MASSGDNGAASRKHLRVILPFSCDSLRIPDKLADDIGGAEALVVGKFKVWPVELGRDGDGAFLGRGWPEFAAACGVGAGWLLVLRHRGRGMLTFKAFDASCFSIRELGVPSPSAETTKRGKDASPRPQFIGLLPSDDTEKMLIPSKFVKNYIHEEGQNSHATVILAPLGKIGQIELEINQMDMFLAGGWSRFLALNGITQDNCLLLRYEGSMVFTVKIFEPDGFQMEFKQKDVRMQQNTEEQQGTVTASFQKSHKNDLQSSGWKNNRRGSSTISNSLERRCVYNIEPPSWIKKLISTSMIKKYISFPALFCRAIGLHDTCMISLKTSLSCTRSWQVRIHPRKSTGHQFGSGWKNFCRENGIRDGDICTFNIIDATLWHVVIEHQ